MPFLKKNFSTRFVRGILVVVVMVVVTGSIYRLLTPTEAVSASVFPRMTQADFLASQRSSPTQAISFLAGQCGGGNWRQQPEPVRHVWVTLRFEVTGDQSANPQAATVAEIDAAYAALGLANLDRSSKSLNAHRGQIAEAREAYIVAHAKDFAFMPESSSAPPRQ